MNEIPSRRNNLDAFWMPFSANRSFKETPRMLARAEGMSYFTQDGREIIDGTAGLWCVNAGHGRREITEAIQKQAAVMDFAPAFNMGHPIAFQAAAKVAEITPEGMDRIFFTNSGSEAADTALKIALAYHRARGDAGRVRLIGRERGYHGVGFGGMSVGGIGANRKQFGALLPYVDHLPHTHLPEQNAFSRGMPEHGAHLADQLENIIALHGAETIAAVMVEPLAGSTGVLIPPQGYLERLRAICTKHGILLIYDEVITGFGRIGAHFGAERFGVIPDIMTMAKGKWRGIGMATYVEKCSGGAPESAIAKFNEDDTITVFVGVQTNGQGHETAFTQIMSARLGVDADRIRIVQGDSDFTPEGMTGGSRSIPVAGAAVLGVSDNIIEKGKLVAASAMEAAVGDIEYADASVDLV